MIKPKNNNILIAGLYIVATPIGNLGDFSLRAIQTLKDVDIIACEDTRTSRTLLNNYQINTKLVSYHDHNGAKMIPFIVDSIKQGKKVALISDAGSPLINDPGYKLVVACRDEDLYVTSIPGAVAFVTALQLSGLSPQSFMFSGFMPIKTGDRKKVLSKLKNYDDITVIFYETAPRILGVLETIKEELGDIRVCVARELTKKFEEVTTDSVTNLISHYKSKEAIKGEIVLLLEIIKPEQELTDDFILSRLRNALQTMDKKAAITFVAKDLEIKKSIVYDLSLTL